MLLQAWRGVLKAFKGRGILESQVLEQSLGVRQALLVRLLEPLRAVSSHTGHFQMKEGQMVLTLRNMDHQSASCPHTSQTSRLRVFRYQCMRYSDISACSPVEMADSPLACEPLGRTLPRPDQLLPLPWTTMTLTPRYSSYSSCPLQSWHISTVMGADGDDSLPTMISNSSKSFVCPRSRQPGTR